MVGRRPCPDHRQLHRLTTAAGVDLALRVDRGRPPRITVMPKPVAHPLATVDANGGADR